MYSHQVFYKGNQAAVRHFREEVRSSGIVVPYEIARSYTKQPQDAAPAPSSLASSDDAFTMMINGTRVDGPVDLNAPHEEIMCADLNEFVRTGNEKWRTILHRLGHAGGVAFELAKRYSETETQRSSGFIIPDSQEEVFLGYVAHPHEIDAVVQLVSVDTPTQEDNSPDTGFYL